MTQNTKQFKPSRQKKPACANFSPSVAEGSLVHNPKEWSKVDDELFKAYFKNVLAPGFEKQYGKKIAYGNRSENI